MAKRPSQGQRNRRFDCRQAPTTNRKKSGQALHGTRRTSLPLLPSGPGGVHAPAHAWHLADADHGRGVASRNNYYFLPSSTGRSGGWGRLGSSRGPVGGRGPSPRKPSRPALGARGPGPPGSALPIRCCMISRWRCSIFSSRARCPPVNSLAISCWSRRNMMSFSRKLSCCLRRRSSVARWMSG